MQIENKVLQNIIKYSFIILTLISKLLNVLINFWKLIHDPLFALFDAIWKVFVAFCLSLIVFGSIAFWPLDLLFNLLPIPETVQNLLVTMQKTLIGLFQPEPAQITPVINNSFDTTSLEQSIEKIFLAQTEHFNTLFQQYDNKLNALMEVMQQTNGMSNVMALNNKIVLLNESMKTLVEQNKEIISTLKTMLTQKQMSHNILVDKLELLTKNMSELHKIVNNNTNIISNVLNKQTKELLLNIGQTNTQTIQSFNVLQEKLGVLLEVQNKTLILQNAIRGTLEQGFHSNLQALNANQELINEYNTNMEGLRENVASFKQQYTIEMSQTQNDAQMAKANAEQAKQQASDIEASLPKQKEATWSVKSIKDWFWNDKK